MKVQNNLFNGAPYVAPGCKVMSLNLKSRIMTYSNDYGDKNKAGKDPLWNNGGSF